MKLLSPKPSSSQCSGKSRRIWILPLLLALGALVATSACEINRLNSAQDHYNNQRYAAAIQELDDYIRTGENGALVTRGEILRGQCYYELGLLALQRENFDLAIKFFKLSNSEEADQALGEIYKGMADKALEQGNERLSLDFVNAILREIPGSELTAEMLNRRIGFRLDTFIDHEGAWQDYMDLYDNYPNNAFEVAARKQILRIIPAKVDYARRLYGSGYYSEALRVLYELAKNPVVESAANNQKIAEAYIGQAESFLKGQNYLEADRFFRIAVQYDPGQKAQVDRRLEQVASLFINRELSWLEFNRRVLSEACAPVHPLIERVKFVSIFSNNLDEFFMIRVAGLQRQLARGVREPPADGMSPADQLAEIHRIL